MEPVESEDPARDSIIHSMRTHSTSPVIAANPAGIRDKFVRLMPWGVWAWMGGVALLALWRIGGLLLIGRWVRHGAAPVPPKWTAVLRELARRIHLNRPVRLIASLKVAVPVTAGWLRPVILFPASLLSGLPPRHIEALLAHELAHIRRMDYVVNLAQIMVETVLFYHPAVWWTGRIIRQEREHCCDDAAIAIHGDVTDYVKALAGLADLQSPTLLPAAKGGRLLLRLRRLLTPHSTSGPALRIPASMAAAGAALGLGLLFVNPPAGIAETKPVAPPANIEPERASDTQSKNEPAAAPKEPDKSPPVETASPPSVNSGRGRILDRNGVILAKSDESGERNYPWGALAAHAVGFSGKGGKLGVERTQNKPLAEEGDVALTLDVRLQLIAEQSMADAGVGRGAAVVVDPKNGDILAMASLPNFDPNIFLPGKQDAAQITALYQDRTSPISNRAARKTSPGSTFKIVTAIAAAKAGLMNNHYNCPGQIDYERPVSCWIYQQQQGGHGDELSLTYALKQSCNCWFYQAGNAMGIDNLAEAARLLGMDAVFTDVEGDQPVFVPDKKWWSENRTGTFTPAETAYASVGQGLVQETPLHMASLVATVANGGEVWKLRLCMTPPAARVHDRILPADQMDVIRNAMRLVVNDPKGTGRAAESRQFTVAGKTGTAAWKRKEENGPELDDNKAWFVGFAPYENPRFAICVMVENGESGGKTAAPIAKRILEQAMSLKEGEPAPAPQRRAPVKGHFRTPGTSK